MSKPKRPPHHANSEGTLFRNPWDDKESEESPFSISSLPRFLKDGWAGFPLEWAKEHTDNPHKPVTVVNPTFGLGLTGKEDRGQEIKATWLGHAGFMVELPSDNDAKTSDPIRMLFDPMFSDRAGPSQWVQVGPGRRLPPPCRIEDLPLFQFIVISHNHYDHLDLPTIMAIHSARGKEITYLVPLRNKWWFTESGIPESQIIELDWWEETTITCPSNDQEVKFICTPAQHNSGRTLLDKGASLWASWVVETHVRKINSTATDELQRVAVFFAGDTGYATSTGPVSIFKDIGNKYGPFDLSLLPIWRGGTLQFVARLGLRITDHSLTSSVHATPSDAIKIHKDIKSRHSLAMHFATFAGSEIEAFEPIVELTQERQKQEDGVKIGEWWEVGGFGVINVGETARVPLDGVGVSDEPDRDL